MISLYTRVYIPHAKLFGRVTERIPMPPSGVMYRVLIETSDGSHVEPLYGSAAVKVAIVQSGPGGAGGAAPAPRVRLVASDGVRV